MKCPLPNLTESKTSAFVPTAAALEALAQPSLPDLEAIQLVHDIWCHPGNDKLEQIYKARRGKGSLKVSSLSFANSNVLLALYLNARAGIAALSA